MEKEIKLPQISEDENTGLVSDVYVKEGDEVEAEQSIIAVESDKATVDVPVEESGTVKEVKVKEGDEISVGDVMIILETDQKEEKEQEDPKSGDEDQSSKEDEEEAEKAGDDSDDEGDEDKEETDREEKESNEQRSEDEIRKRDPDEERGDKAADVAAAPLAKKFARELGIDINDLKKDDPEDRITREEVFDYAKKIITRKSSGRQSGDTKSQGIELPDFTQWGDVERQPLSGVRRATAEKTSLSWTHIPHVTHFDQADVTSLEDFRQNKDEEAEEKVTITSILLKVLGAALMEFPKFNASIDIVAKEVIYKKYVNIGLAVDTDDGLLLPVIRDVDKKPILELSGEIAELAEKAVAGELSSNDMKGGNFVISNLGAIGGTNFTPIIFPPQVAILGVSKTQIQPVFQGKEFEPRQMLPLSLSYDHRLIDGADAARFLRWICESLEQPMNLMMDR